MAHKERHDHEDAYCDQSQICVEVESPNGEGSLIKQHDRNLDKSIDKMADEVCRQLNLGRD
jgi:hypothetical protein